MKYRRNLLIALFSVMFVSMCVLGAPMKRADVIAEMLAPAHLYEFTSDAVTDSTGGTSLTAMGVTVEEQEGRSYAKFQGESYLALPAGFITTDAITIAMDICPTSSGDFQKVLTYGVDFGKYFQIALRTGSAGHVNVEAQLTQTGSGEVAVWGYKALDAFTLNVWHKLVVTVDKGYVKIFADGALLNERQCPYTLGELIGENPQNLFIGKSMWADPYFEGGIDNLAIYNECLTTEQVAEYFGADLAPDINTGIKAYYSFDDAEDMGYDDSGNETMPVLNNIVSAEGKFSGAAEFSGESYMLMPSDTVSATANAFTFSAWMYSTSTGDFQKPMAFGRDTTVFLQIMFRPGVEGKLNLETTLTIDGDQGSTATCLWGSTAFSSVTLNEWNHIALTVDGTYARLFVNGKVVNCGYYQKSINDFTAQENAQMSNYIGKSHFNDPYYQGKMDEVAIYNRALSGIDIAALAGGMLPKKHEKPTPEIPDTTTGLTHYYSFDNGDYAGLENLGSKNNANVIGGVAEGKFGNAFSADGGYIQMPSSAIDGEANAFTFATWMYPTSTGDFQKLMDFGRDTDVFLQIMLRPGVEGKLNIETGLTVDGDRGSTKVQLWGGAGFNAITLNEWNHVALTINGKSAILYVNGVRTLYGDFAKELTEFCAMENAQSANYVGKSHFNDPLFMGMIDEVLLYNRALSAVDVGALYGGFIPEKVVTEGEQHGGEDADATSGLLYYYSFDGSVAGIDYSGNMNNAIISSRDIRLSAKGAGEQLGQYMVFNGANDFMVLPENIVPKETSAFTFTAWVYFDGLSEFTRIFDFGESSCYFDFRLRKNGILETTLTNNATAGETSVTTKQNAVTAGKWQHLALTVDANAVTIYVDGVVVGVGNFSRNLNTLYNENLTEIKQNYIGLSRYGQDPKLGGGMDEIRIYHRALTAEDIKYLAEGNKAEIEGAKYNEGVLVNGEKPVVEYVTAVDKSIRVVGDNYIIKSAMTSAQLKEKITLIGGAHISLADNYDFEIKDNDSIYDGYYIKVHYGNAVVLRIRIYLGDYSVVTLNMDNGEDIRYAIVKNGGEYKLPYAVKGGCEYNGYSDGNTVFKDKITVSGDINLKAVYSDRDYVITIDMRNGTFETITAKAGETVTLTNYGVENLVGYYYGNAMVELGEFIMPAMSIQMKAMFALETIDGNTVTFTTYHGEFSSNQDGTITSEQGNSLGILDGVQLESGTIVMKIRASTANDCGVLFWADDGGRDSFWEEEPSQYHVALLNWEGWLLIGKVNHDGKTWNCVSDIKLPNFDVNHEYVMKVVLTDSNVKIYLDGVLYLDYTDNGSHRGGKVGFRCASKDVVFKIEQVSIEKKEENI